VLLVICLAALDGRTSTATAGAVLLAVSGVFGPVTELAGQVDNVLSARAALRRVLELCAEPAAPEPAGTTPEPDPQWTLDGLGFGYDPDRPVLFDVSLTVGPGEHVALVGATGSGKSTVLRLAGGLVEVGTGSARLGGTDATALRDPGFPAVLLFPQRSYAVHGSVLDNVRLWRPDATPDAVRAAAADLGFADWLRGLPGELDTPVGFGGSGLSGPDRQRLALLGLLLLDPRPIALDEPTSLLPPDEQPRVLGALRRRFAGHGMLVASHHQSTARLCDRVAFLAGGRLVATGSHDELMRRSAGYRALWSTVDGDTS
jgi:ABC-type multidrug transport system fused ATPase/permease subunit